MKNRIVRKVAEIYCHETLPANLDVSDVWCELSKIPEISLINGSVRISDKINSSRAKASSTWGAFFMRNLPVATLVGIGVGVGIALTLGNKDGV